MLYHEAGSLSDVFMLLRFVRFQLMELGPRGFFFDAGFDRRLCCRVAPRHSAIPAPYTS